MAKILVAYYTKNQQTKKIAEFIRTALVVRGHAVALRDIEKCEVVVEDFDAVIAGAPVYVGQYPRAFKKWAFKNSAELVRRPSAFFSVCLGILQKDPEVQAQERKFVEDFFRATDWYPQLWSIFAGSLKYSKYNWLVKAIMETISARAGSLTQSDRDYEFTDWSEVKRFTIEFACNLEEHRDARDWPPKELSN
ncbi:MAG: flavodoxin domain-containing protein [Bdellovibrionota bacterium]